MTLQTQTQVQTRKHIKFHVKMHVLIQMDVPHSDMDMRFHTKA